jgi:hypothetical protein
MKNPKKKGAGGGGSGEPLGERGTNQVPKATMGH